MNKYVVRTVNMGDDYDYDSSTKLEVIEADNAVVTSNGDLKLTMKQGACVEIYAEGVWKHVRRLEEEPENANQHPDTP